MHIVKPYETAVSLFGADGQVFVYPSLRAALKARGIRWIRAHVGRHFREFSHVSQLGAAVYAREAVYTVRDYIMRDDFGAALTAADFEPLVGRGRYGVLGRRARRWPAWSGTGPVPGTGRHNWGYCHRRLHTTPERRWAQFIREEGEPAPRAARNVHNIPDSWDDYPILSREDRNWKRFRKTRWK